MKVFGKIKFPILVFICFAIMSCSQYKKLSISTDPNTGVVTESNIEVILFLRSIDAKDIQIDTEDWIIRIGNVKGKSDEEAIQSITEGVTEGILKSIKP